MTPYIALISACEKSKQVKQALKTFEAMYLQDVVPQVITYNALISTCRKAKQPEQAVEVFQAM